MVGGVFCFLIYPCVLCMIAISFAHVVIVLITAPISALTVQSSRQGHLWEEV